LFQGSLGDFRERLLKLFSGPFVSYRLQGAGDRLGPEDPLDGSCLKGLIADGMFDRLMNILALVVLLHPQDGSGLEPTVSGMSFGQSLEKRLSHLSQFQKGLSNGLQTVTPPFVLEVIRVLDPFSQSYGRSFVAGKELNLWRVDQNFVLCGFEGQDISDMLGRGRVEVRFKLDEPVCIANSQGHFRAVIGMKG
jgi:hypothetical protein